MTEQEFRSHVADVNAGDEPLDQILHFTRVTAKLLNLIASSPFLLGKPPFRDEAVNPFTKRADRDPDARLSDAEYAAAVERRVAQNQNCQVRE